MDPNTNPLGATPATPSPVPDPVAPTAPGAPADTGLDALSDLGNLANELNNYDATAELAAMANAASTQTAAPAPTPASAPAAPAEPASTEPASAEPISVEPVSAEPAPVAADPSLAGAAALQPSADLVANAAAPSTAPELAAPATELSAPELSAPELAAPTFQPSADLVASATVSASPNGAPAPELATPATELAATPELAAPSPLENIEPLAPENPTETPNVADSITPVSGPEANSGSDLPESTDLSGDENVTAAPAVGEDAEKKKKVKAAAPVPGSIGSMKSYADIQREEAERMAKAAAAEAAKQNGKKPINRTTALIVGAATLVVAIIATFAIIAIASNSEDADSVAGNNKPGSTPTEASTTTLICSIPMRPEEFAGMPGVLSAKRVNTFEFSDDELSSLKTEQIYYMDSAQSAINAKNGYDSEHPEVRNAGELAEPAIEDEEPSEDGEDEEEEEEEEEEEDEEVDPNNRYSYENITTTASGATYTFTRYVSEELISDWLTSKFYSDVEYGLIVRDPNNPDSSRTKEDYKSAQNSLGYTCTMTEE